MPTSSKRIPRSVSAPVFRKTSRRLVNVLLFKLRDMRIATRGLYPPLPPPPPHHRNPSLDDYRNSYILLKTIPGSHFDALKWGPMM
ncbi:hypothetical protein OSTOST_10485, partial [Ostertagia ostertagi]